jgi:hypothetical protein
MKLGGSLLLGFTAATLLAQEFPTIDRSALRMAMKEAKRARKEALASDRAAFALRKPLFFAQGGPKRGGGTLTGDEEMKLMAIDSLMQSDSERAIPLLDKLLQNQQASLQLRSRALHALGHSSSTKAREIVVRVAKDGSNSDLQSRALHLLGSRGSTQNNQLLNEIYASAASVEIKRQVLHALSRQGDAKQLIALARKETNPELKRDALQHLSRMKSEEVTAFLMELLEK